MPDTASKLSPVSIGLHWLVGIMMITLLAVGIYMEENEVYFLYPIHKSFGVLVILVAVPRIIWRIKNGWPAPAAEYKGYEQLLSRLVHWLLILATVMMPISGMLMSGMGGHGIAVFGLELMANNPDPADPGSVIAVNGSLAGLGHTMHGIGGNVLLFAVVLHVVGALKHHVVDKDGTLRRMLGARL